MFGLLPWSQLLLTDECKAQRGEAFGWWPPVTAWGLLVKLSKLGPGLGHRAGGGALPGREAAQG